MAHHIIFNKTTGRYMASVRDLRERSDEANQAIVNDLVAQFAGNPDVDMLVVDTLPDASNLSDMVIKDGKVELTPERVAALAKRDARRAAKKAAKKDAKLDTLRDMTAKDFGDMTAAQKWDLVFTFMKAQLDD